MSGRPFDGNEDDKRNQAIRRALTAWFKRDDSDSGEGGMTEKRYGLENEKPFGRQVNGRTFEVWKVAADMACLRLCGLTTDDLPDADYRDRWDAGEDAEDVVRDILADEGWADGE